MLARPVLRSRQVIQQLAQKSFYVGLHTLTPRMGAAPSTVNRAASLLLRQRQIRCFSSGGDGPIFSIESDEDFNTKVINSESPVLVDFYADWCGPCKMFGPRLEAKVSGRDGQITLGKVNVDEVFELADDFQIRSVPTIIAFKGGEPVVRIEGAIEDHQLDELIDQLTQQE